MRTVVAAVVTSNAALAAMPGNVFMPAVATGLPRDSVVNVTALVTLDKADLAERAGTVAAAALEEVDRGLRQVLGLGERGWEPRWLIGGGAEAPARRNGRR